MKIKQPAKPRKVCPCGKPSIPGLIRGVALCQQHYNDLMFGTGEAHAYARELLRDQHPRH